MKIIYWFRKHWVKILVTTAIMILLNIISAVIFGVKAYEFLKEFLAW